MMAFALFLYLLAIVCWLGGIIFFSFFTAPIIFTRLPIAEAGKVVAGIFPLYYTAGIIAGTISFVLALYFAAIRGPRGPWSVAAIALAIALGLTSYAGLVVRPRIDAIRSVAEETTPDPEKKSEFDRLHRLSVTLNGAVLILDLAALAATAGALVRHG